MKRTAFTMIELVFVIVVLGILAAIAIPKFAATRDDAQVAKGRSDVSAIRSAIVSERQTRLLKGDTSYVSALDGVSTNLFDGPDINHTLLQYGITPGSGNGKWTKVGTTYTYTVMSDPVAFTYTQLTGSFDCNHTNVNCKRLTE
ncbi:MAG: type II secretion system protein [Sulfuricurvum sp.]|nr:type II secretion system protein [Sulfuricurvum sp.]